MSSSTTCAVVVTFHPGDDVLANLSAIQPQVAHLVVVDNGSTENELELLRQAQSQLNFALIENADNLGIATALNQGIHHAQSTGAEYVLLFDQDSCATPGFADAMLHGHAASQWGDRLGILMPRYVDKRSGNDVFPGTPVPTGGIEVAITSGSLLSIRTFVEHGFFLDALFIDSVDTEHSLRLRKAGLVLDVCCDAVLLHSPGTPQLHHIFGRVIQTENYAPLRRYYQERNKVWIALHYFGTFPNFCLHIFRLSLLDFVKILLVEDNKLRKAAFFLRGIFDGLRGRLGKLDNR